MPSLPSLSTALTWGLYFIPIYLFVIAPFISQILPSSWTTTQYLGYDDYDPEDDLLPTTGMILDEKYIGLEDGVPIECPGDEYKVHMLRRDPMVIYIEGFLAGWEADHMLKAR